NYFWKKIQEEEVQFQTDESIAVLNWWPQSSVIYIKKLWIAGRRSMGMLERATSKLRVNPYLQA
ncbi:MAG: hypothetical protein JW915_21840, partial [Chitinispirillaceae bacterium]|nr:hypothetical protein [Chitinispirillaceae bacterium]